VRGQQARKRLTADPQVDETPEPENLEYEAYQEHEQKNMMR
jgi:hypothetical protein